MSAATRAAATITLGLFLASPTRGQEGPPPLDAPGGAPSSGIALPSVPAPTPAVEGEVFHPTPPSLRPAFRPVTAPPRESVPTFMPTPPLAAPAPAVAAEPELPPLTSPDGAPQSADALPPVFDAPGRPGGPPPLTLESSPIDALPPGERPRPKPSRPDPSPPPSRRFRPFGMFRPAPTSSADRVPDRDDDDPAPDPAADAALKRRIESQARQVVGAHVRSLDVRVVDRRVTIRARTDRFWHRRGVQRGLEQLPALTGRRADIRVDE